MSFLTHKTLFFSKTQKQIKQQEHSSKSLRLGYVEENTILQYLVITF